MVSGGIQWRSALTAARNSAREMMVYLPKIVPNLPHVVFCSSTATKAQPARLVHRRRRLSARSVYTEPVASAPSTGGGPMLHSNHGAVEGWVAVLARRQQKAGQAGARKRSREATWDTPLPDIPRERDMPPNDTESLLGLHKARDGDLLPILHRTSV